MRNLFLIPVMLCLFIITGCTATNRPVEFRLFLTTNMYNQLGPCGCRPGGNGGISRRAWLIEQYKQQNGFLPIQVELGNTTSNTSDFSFIITKTLYPLFERINLDAVLLEDYELRDLDQFFIERIQMPVPNVLSNVYAKNPETEYAKLKQYHSVSLGSGVKVYLVNIIDPARFDRLRANNNYHIIEPIDFLAQFSNQISSNDILIARLSIKDDEKMKTLLESPEASRIDLAIIPHMASNQILDVHENELSRSHRGWIPRSQPQSDPEPELGPPEDWDFNELTQYQGGELIVDLKPDNRQFMEITNQFRAIPEPRSAEFIREVHFVKDPDGSFLIKVADIIIDNKLPPVEDIEQLVEETEQTIQFERRKSSINHQISNIERRLNLEQTNPYTGPEACKDCHPGIYENWKESSHSHALQTLTQKGEHNNSNCISCHVTEWKQPDYFTSGWNFEHFGEELGCESCHGPGLPHINLIDFASDRRNREFWNYIKSSEPKLLTRNLTVEARSMCMECHDFANSPDFDFVKYWEKIEHPKGETEKSIFESD